MSQDINVTINGNDYTIVYFDSNLIFGTGIPSDSVGQDYNYYLNRSNGDVYRKRNGTWGTSITNLKGPIGTGLTGPAGPAGPAGADGVVGEDGTSYWVYIAYASNDQGTDFTTIFDETLDYIAILTSDTEIETPQASDFTGLWKRYVGEDGAAGVDGSGCVKASYTGLIDGNNTEYTLDNNYLDVQVFINGVLYADDYYSYGSGVLTFNEAFPVGTELLIFGISNLGDTSYIDDNQTVANYTWSSSKIDTQLNGKESSIHSADTKITPVDVDEFGLIDSEASNVLKKLTWSNLKATLKTYFDNFYQTALTFGISNTNTIQIDSESVADGEYARFTASGLESRSTSEVKSDIGLGNVVNILCKYDATVEPTVENDIDEGYSVGSYWHDITNDKAYVCLDNTDGAAVWTEITQSGGSSGGINVETLTGDKTLVASDEPYQLLDCNGSPRIVNLPMSDLTSGQTFTFKNIETLSFSNYLYIKQSGTGIDKIYPGSVRTVIFDGTNWEFLEPGFKHGSSYYYNIALGSDSRAYNDGIAIGRGVEAMDDSIALGGINTEATNKSISIGAGAGSDDYGTALGYNAKGTDFSIGIGAYAYGSYSTSTNTYNIAIGGGTAANPTTAKSTKGALTDRVKQYQIGIGHDVYVSGQDSVAIGSFAKIDKELSVAFGGQYSYCDRTCEILTSWDGSNKKRAGKARWSGQTTDATPTEIFLGAKSNERFTLAASSYVSFEGHIIGFEDTTLNKGRYTFKGGITRDASGNTTLDTTITPTTEFEDSAGWGISITADDSNEALIITVTGAAGVTVDWVAEIDFIEIRK